MAYAQKEEWHNSCASCCLPFSTCLLSWFCPCMVYGRMRHRVKNGNLNEYSTFNPSCAAFCGLTCLGVGFILPMISRGDMRAKYALKGDACTDCLLACCCAPCDLTQQDKEAEHREGRPLIANAQQPQAHDAMTYQAQSKQAHDRMAYPAQPTQAHNGLASQAQQKHY
ncbi:PLAC8-domain-containing protein [Sporormia fimetaria CBS 119925]|uniref:PLAC8-domain-containing protein n=1 Tax=Sporormia fimetaria CBS 119925 TaxID=1340428 RepID=A0A6A6VHC3_9PLEO|nr:PLAC8-domain-containing protein [Sporormia fimetaria CBS 119925]